MTDTTPAREQQALERAREAALVDWIGRKVAGFKPFDGLSYNGLAEQIIAQVLEALTLTDKAQSRADAGLVDAVMTVPTCDKCDTYVAGQYMFNYLRTFLAAAGIDASKCRLVIELPDRATQRQLVSAIQRDSRGPPRSAGKIGNHSGFWQGVEYEISVKGWSDQARQFGYDPSSPDPTEIERLRAEVERLEAEKLEPLWFETPVGKDLAEWRENVRKTDLCRRGDTVLVWVNEGDLIEHQFRRAALKGGE